ncbi:hypothetical protein [Methylocystis echinoides]|uniref:hypothetical protein n=1 Tax=Methylocystis echinoides TaxID=29468 RepID=UPI00343F6052
MPNYNAMPICIATVFAVSLVSPAVARCARPNGSFVGGGAGPVYAPGGALLGNQSETWKGFIPMKDPTNYAKGGGGNFRIVVRTPPQPGVPTSAFGDYGYYIDYPTYSLTWDEDACRGTLSLPFKSGINARWFDQNGNQTEQEYPGPRPIYNLTVAANGSVLIATLDPTNLSTRYPSDPRALPAYVPAYRIRLEKQ